jgi:hypothetical protein
MVPPPPPDPWAPSLQSCIEQKENKIGLLVSGNTMINAISLLLCIISGHAPIKLGRS